MTDKIELLHELYLIRDDYATETDPEKRKQLHDRGWKIRRLLGLSMNPEVEKRQLAALEAAERERQKGAR